MEIIQNLQLELSGSNKIKTVYINQYEYNSRFLRIQLINNGKVFHVDQVNVASLEAIRPGGGVNDFIGTIEKDGKILIPLEYWIAEIFGTVRCKLSIVSPQGNKLTSTRFLIKVEASDTENHCCVQINHNSAITQVIATENQRIFNENERILKDKERESAIENIQSQIDKIVATDKASLKEAIDEYFKENPIEAGTIFEPGSNMTLENGKLSVKVTDILDPNSDLPVTSRAVSQIVGNIEIFLNTI